MSRGYNRRRFVVRVLVSSKLRTVISVANTIFTLGGVRLASCVSPLRVTEEIYEEIACHVTNTFLNILIWWKSFDKWSYSKAKSINSKPSISVLN